jgi:hypothetical protein
VVASTSISLQIEALVVRADARTANLMPDLALGNGCPLSCSNTHARESHGYDDFATQIRNSLRRERTAADTFIEWCERERMSY